MNTCCLRMMKSRNRLDTFEYLLDEITMKGGLYQKNRWLAILPFKRRCKSMRLDVFLKLVGYHL